MYTHKIQPSRLPITQLPLWPSRYSPPNIAARLLRHLAAWGWVESLFEFAADHDADYSSLWRMVRYLSRTGQVGLWTRPGYPTVITRAESAQSRLTVGLRHFPAFQGVVVGKDPNGDALVMVQHHGGSGHKARHVAIIPFKNLVSNK
jgi:hypothetical protein